MSEPTETSQFSGIPRDTTPDAFWIQCDVLSRLTPGQRMQIAFQLNGLAEELCEAGIRRRHPDYSQEDVKLALARMRLGDEFFQMAFPGVEIEL
jgi:hypothetical protein